MLLISAGMEAAEREHRYKLMQAEQAAQQAAVEEHEAAQLQLKTLTAISMPSPPIIEPRLDVISR